MGSNTQEASKMDYIKVINGRWTINTKTFSEMTLKERQLLDEKVKCSN